MFELKRPYRKPKPKSEDKQCHRCHGSGFSTCPTCGGTGTLANSRNPLGAAGAARCTACYGNRRSRCRTCRGSGLTSTFG